MQEIKGLDTEKIIVMYQNTHNEEYLQEILKRNEGLIHQWAFDYRNIPSYGREDLEAEANIALWRAVESFDPSRGMKFTSCLKGWIKQAYNRIYNEATRAKRYDGSEPASYEELEEINLEKFTVDDYTEAEIREFIDSLAGTTQTVAVLLLEGFSKSEVARELKITPASTTYHVKRLLKSYLAFEGVAVCC